MKEREMVCSEVSIEAFRGLRGVTLERCGARSLSSRGLMIWGLPQDTLSVVPALARFHAFVEEICGL
jgi:hypothetical protein